MDHARPLTLEQFCQRYAELPKEIAAGLIAGQPNPFDGNPSFQPPPEAVEVECSICEQDCLVGPATQAKLKSSPEVVVVCITCMATAAKLIELEGGKMKMEVRPL